MSPLSTPLVPQDNVRRRVFTVALLAATLAAGAALFWPHTNPASVAEIAAHANVQTGAQTGVSTGAEAGTRFVPLQVSLAFVVLLCVASLGALEIRRRQMAALLAAPVVLAIAATIVAWVFALEPPLGIVIFGTPDASWFPSRGAIEAVIPTALMSLAIIALSAERLLPVVAPFAWATGLLLIVAPPTQFALLRLSEITSGRLPLQQGEIPAALSLMSIGLALIFSRLVRGVAATTFAAADRGARWRALIAVLAIAATIALWYAVRVTEIRQLRGDLEIAVDEATRSLKDGLADSTASAERLWQHWYILHWQIPDEMFLNDARLYMRRQTAVAATAMMNDRGGIMRVARRQIALGAPQSDADSVELADRNDWPAALTNDAQRLALVNSSFASKTPLIGQPFVADNGISFTQAIMPIIDESGKPLGALWILFRWDTTVGRILEDVATDFHIRVQLNGRPLLDRPPRDGVYSREDRFRRVERRDINAAPFIFDIAPSERIVTRSLSWTPLLVLLFAWASLLLLMFALYNERRVNALFRERERILNQSLDLICTLQPDGTIVTANEAATRLLGVSRQSLVGRSLLDFVPQEHRERLRQEWLIRTAEPHAPPMPFRHADNRTIFLQAVSRWSPEEQLLYCAFRDVTSEQELFSQRQHAEDTFRIGVAQAGCAVYEYQPGPSAQSNGRIEWVGAIRALTGYEPAELSAAGFRGWMDLVHPEDAPHVRHTFDRCLETLQPHTVDYRLRRKDGAYVAVLDRGRHLADAGTPRMIGALIDLTTIRQQETALRRSEERYRIIASQVGAVILERETATGRIRAFGPVEQIFGYTKEQLESRPLTRDDTMIHPEDRAHYFTAVEAAEQTLTSYYVEHRRRHRGGHYIYIASRGVVLPGPDGRAEREVIAITDISERKLAETRLQESEERFRLAAEQARQIVYDFAFDDKMRIVELRFAGATEQVFGYTQADLRDLQAQDRFALIHPDDIPAVRASGAESSASIDQFNLEHRVRHRDGHYVYAENRGAVKRDAAGHVIGIVGMLLDITARKSAETERQNYTAQLRTLADIAHKVGTMLSLHELLRFLTTSMRELLGANAAAALVSDPALAPDDVIAVSYAEHYGVQRGSPASLGSHELLSQVRADNTPRRYTVEQMKADHALSQLTQRDDLRHPLRGWIGAPLIARDGANLGLLELSDKIEGEFTEGDLQVLNQLAGLASVAIENIRLYATLEERVAARTHELEISNRELEAFSYSVSHDLRAPLRAIAGFSSILEAEYTPKLDSAARRYLQRITAGVERMANLIDDLLSLARVSRADLKREPVDLTALSKSVIKRHTERAAQRSVEIVVDPKMKAVADPRLLEVALENLIENALKFSSTRAQSRVHVGQRRIDGRLVFYVADNGVGFDPKYASNLFGVFQRLHSASDFPGTGVGLATVQRIVQRHHGRIWAEADVDSGATFYFTLTNEA